VKVPFQELKGRRGWIAFLTSYMDGNSKLNAIETKKNKNKMEEKIIMAMEVEHATLKGGKAKPNSRDE